MAWTDSFIGRIPDSKLVIDADGTPFVSTKIAPQEYVEIELNIQHDALPYNIYFRRFDAIGGELENRLFAQVGDRELAYKSAMEVITCRLNSMEFVLDGE
jgi:hypothetical protein